MTEIPLMGNLWENPKSVVFLAFINAKL